MQNGAFEFNNRISYVTRVACWGALQPRTATCSIRTQRWSSLAFHAHPPGATTDCSCCPYTRSSRTQASGSLENLGTVVLDEPSFEQYDEEESKETPFIDELIDLLSSIPVRDLYQ